MRLARRPALGATIPLTPLVDVMLILLVFFMVTSTYLDLDMIPMVAKGQAPATATVPPAPADGAATAGDDGAAAPGTLLLRLTADGRSVLRGRALSREALAAALAARVAADAETRVLVLPSGAADAQALVSLLETAERAGVADLRVVRLEAR